MDANFDTDKLSLKQGDVLVISVEEENFTLDDFQAGIETLKKSIESDLGFKLPVVVLSSGIKLEAVGKEKLEAIIDMLVINNKPMEQKGKSHDQING